MKLIEEARQAWRFWSVRFAAVAAVLVAGVTANPALLLGLIDRLPEGWRAVASVLSGLIAFGVPTLLRIAQQPNLTKGQDDG